MPTNDKTNPVFDAVRMFREARAAHSRYDMHSEDMIERFQTIEAAIREDERSKVAIPSAASPRNACPGYSKGHAGNHCGNCGKPRDAHASSVADTKPILGAEQREGELLWAVQGAFIATDEHGRKVWCVSAKSCSDIERERDRLKDSERQLLCLSDWCRKTFGVDTNSVIGKDGWPNTLVECVIKAIASATQPSKLAQVLAEARGSETYRAETERLAGDSDLPKAALLLIYEGSATEPGKLGHLSRADIHKLAAGVLEKDSATEGRSA